MNVECRLLYKFKGGQFIQPVFTSICQYLPVNTTGMENTHICQHFANLAVYQILAELCPYENFCKLIIPANSSFSFHPIKLKHIL